MVLTSPNRSRFEPSCSVNPAARRARQPEIELDDKATEPETSWNRAQIAATVHRSPTTPTGRAQIWTNLCAIPGGGGTDYNYYCRLAIKGRRRQGRRRRRVTQTQLRLATRRTKREKTSPTFLPNTWRHALWHSSPTAIN